MPKYVPTQKLRDALAEPIEFELGGKDFAIQRVSVRLLDGIAKSSKAAERNETTVIDQFFEEIFREIGQSAALEALQPIDMREAVPLMKWLGDQFNEMFGEQEKNSLASPESSPEDSPACSATPTSVT